MPDRYLVSQRDPWYAVERAEPPDVIVSPMGKDRFRAVANDAAILIANSLYGSTSPTERSQYPSCDG